MARMPEIVSGPHLANLPLLNHNFPSGNALFFSPALFYVFALPLSFSLAMKVGRWQGRKSNFVETIFVLAALLFTGLASCLWPYSTSGINIMLYSSLVWGFCLLLSLTPSRRKSIRLFCV